MNENEQPIVIEIDELIDFVYEKTNGAIPRDTLNTIFELETDFMIAKGVIEVVDNIDSELGLEGN